MKLLEHESKAGKVIVVIALMIAAIGLGVKVLTDNPEYILLETINTGDTTRIDDSLGLVVILEHYRDEVLIDRVEKENDIFLKNFGSYWAASFQGTDSGVGVYYNVYNENDGSTKTFYWADENRIDNTNIHIGTGTTAPALTDWSLETEAYEKKVMQIVYSVTGSQMNVTMACSFTIDASYAITEVGYSNMLYAGTGNIYVMMARDITPAPLNVVEGDIVTVKYVIMLN